LNGIASPLTDAVAAVPSSPSLQAASRREHSRRIGKEWTRNMVLLGRTWRC